MKPTTTKGENLYKNIKMHHINYWFFISQQSQLFPTFKAICLLDSFINFRKAQ